MLTEGAPSNDGTVIGFSRVGSGPVVVLLHGAGQSAASFRILAEELSAEFTVIVPDRRGRGMSPHYGDYQGLVTEVADLEAVMEATGARKVFALSSGAVIAIETARSGRAMDKLALYEPPLSFGTVVHGQWAPRYEELMAQQRPGMALATVLKATSDRTLFRLIPTSLLGKLFDVVIRRTAERPTPEGTPSPRELVPTIHYDAITVLQAAGPLERFASLHPQILLMGGTRSAHNLGASLDGLAAVLPNAKRVTLAGVGHTAADNGGRPRLVAEQLREFFR